MVPSVWREQLDKTLPTLPLLIVELKEREKMIVIVAERKKRVLVSFTIGTEIHYL